MEIDKRGLMKDQRKEQNELKDLMLLKLDKLREKQQGLIEQQEKEIDLEHLEVKKKELKNLKMLTCLQK